MRTSTVPCTSWLLGLYLPSQGQILYDGEPLEVFNLRDLRAQFGVVLQEAMLFSGTISENIAYGLQDVDTRRLRSAAKLSLIHAEVMAMPLKYETDVGEGGSALSGGQRQRVALARVLMQEPAVLLLDEAMSHLDAATESCIDRNLSSLSCTRIVIAHRLSTIRNADRIVVLHEGRIVEEGSHDQLMRASGHYRGLVETQSEAPYPIGRLATSR